jgi:hypothetical protein
MNQSINPSISLGQLQQKVIQDWRDIYQRQTGGVGPHFEGDGNEITERERQRQMKRKRTEKT